MTELAEMCDEKLLDELVRRYLARIVNHETPYLEVAIKIKSRIMRHSIITEVEVEMIVRLLQLARDDNKTGAEFAALRGQILARMNGNSASISPAS